MEDRLVSSTLGNRFRVANWAVDVRELQVTNGGQVRKLESQVMRLLVCLASRPGRTVTRKELEGMLWPGLVVSYDSLTAAVAKLRKALVDDSKHPKVIETVPKVGYRLIAAVEPGTETTGGATESDKDLERCATQAKPTHSKPSVEEQPPTAVGTEAQSRTIRLSNNTKISKLTQLRTAAAATVLLVAALSLIWRLSWAPDFEPLSPDAIKLPLPDNPSIAVLPFENLSEDPNRDYLSEGLSENIITELSRFRDLFVIAHNSTMAYRDNPVKVQQVARELGVRYVVEGSIQTTEDRIRVTAQLNDAVSGKHIWAERFDRPLEDIFKVQDEITRFVVSNLKTSIDLSELDRIRAKPPESLKTYELFRLGMSRWLTFTRKGTEESKQLFEKALDIDPEHVKSVIGLAHVYLQGYRHGWSETHLREESLELAFEYANKAVTLAPFDFDAHYIVGKTNKHAHNLEKAVVEYDKAIELNPNAADVLAESADLLIDLGRAEEALERVQTAMRLNPWHPDWYYWSLGDTYYFSGQCEAALRTYRKMNNMPTLVMDNVAAALMCLNREEEARAVMREFLLKEPDYSLRNVGPGWHKAYRDRLVAHLREAGMPE